MQVTGTTQDAVDSLVDSVLLSAHPRIAAIAAEVRDIRGEPLAIVQFRLGEVAWSLGADAAQAAAQDLALAGSIIEQPEVAAVGRRLALAASRARSQAACMSMRAA